MGWYVAAQCLIVPMVALGVIIEGSFFPFFVPWVFFSVLLAFLAGTYERTDLVRTERGRVSMEKVWRVCFIARPAEKIQPHRYLGVRTSATYQITIMDIALFLFLGLFFCFPAFIFWALVLRKPAYYVHLTDEYGHAAVRVYTGRSDEQMHDISDTLHEVTGLPQSVG
jgi:hypothetical protein